MNTETRPTGDPIKGWRPRIIRHPHPSPPLGDAAREQAARLEAGVVDENIARNLDHAGSFRATDCPSFTEAERDVVVYALRGIKWFHRQLMLSRGLRLAVTPLTPAGRRVLRLLLTGLSEKKIAAELGRSYHTTHERVTALFRKFGVNDRAAVMSLWLGQAA